MPNDHDHHQGPFYVVSRSGDFAAGSGWGKYASLNGPGGAKQRRDQLRDSGCDAVIVVEIDD